MARKPQVAELKLRFPVELHRMIKNAARKGGRPVNQEVVQRLQNSFVDQGVEDLIQSTAVQMADLIIDQIQGSLKGVAAEVHDIGVALKELKINRKQGEDSNG